MDETNYQDIEKNFGYIGSVLNVMREENAVKTNNLDKVLSNISNQLDLLSDEENANLIKIFLTDLKKTLEEKHNFVSAKFDEIETTFKDLAQKSENQLKAEEIKEVFDIIAGNLNLFARDFSAQKDVLAEINIQIEALKQDDSQKTEIIKNISVLKNDLEKVSNGFESVILNLNTNFKEVTQNLLELDSKESLADIKKDIETIFLSSNAVLSTMQVIDRKNRELEEIIHSMVTKEDFSLEREQVATLITQSAQMAEYISTLPKQIHIETLAEKVDTSVGVINALKNMLNESGKQNQELLTIQLDNLESKILNISSEEEFIGFRKELKEFADAIIQSTNLMRSDLETANTEMKETLGFLGNLNIDEKLESFSEATKNSEASIKENLAKVSSTVSKEIKENKNLITVDFNKGLKTFIEKIEETKQELTDNSKLNLSSVTENIQDVINNLFSVKNALHIENLESAEALDEKLLEIKENLSSSNNIVIQNSQENLENIISNIEKVFEELIQVKENVNESSTKHVENLAASFNEISRKVSEIKGDLNQNSQENFANLLSIVEDFSKEISTLKISLQDMTQENSVEIKSSVEDLNQTLQSFKTTLEQSSSVHYSGLKSYLENLLNEFNAHKQLLSESAQVNFETVSLYIQNLNKKIEETKSEFADGLKTNIDQMQDSILAIPETIKENQIIFENEKRMLIEDNSKNIQDMGERVQNLIQSLMAQEIPFKKEVLDEFLALKSTLELVKQDLEQSTQSLGGNLEAQISNNLEKIGDVLNQNSERYNLSLFNLQNKLSNSLESIQQAAEQSDLKLNNSILETFEIKAEIQSILKNISLLSDNSALSDLATTLQNRFSEILANINNLEEVFESKSKASLQNILTSLDDNFTIVSDNLKKYSDLTVEEGNLFAADLNEKVETIKNSINLTGTDILNILDARSESLKDIILPISESVNKILAIDFKKMAEEIKNQIDSSYFSITSVINDDVKKGNEEQLEKIEENFVQLNEKLEEFTLRGSSDRADTFNEINAILAQFQETRATILSEMQALQTDTKMTLENELENNATTIRNICASTESAISDVIGKTAELTEEKVLGKIEEAQTSITEGQNINKTSILDEFQSGISEIKELFTSTEPIFADMIEKTAESTEEKVFEKIEAVKNKLSQIQNETSSIILKELQENSEFMRESLASINLDEEVTAGFNQKIDALLSSFDNTSEEIENILTTSETLYKTSTQAMLSDVKTSFCEKVEDNFDELKSFIELLDSKNDLSETLETLKSNIFDKFSEITDSVETSISSISVKGDLAVLSQEIEVSIENLFKNIQSDLLSLVDDSQTINDLTNNSLEIIRRVEDLKNIVAQDISEKLDVFELDFDNQKLLLNDFKEELTTSLDEFKETHMELSLNSTAEMSKMLLASQDSLSKIEKKVLTLNVGKSIETALKTPPPEFVENFDIINQKLDLLCLDDSSEIEEDVQQIKQLVTSQSEVLKQLDKLEKLQKLDGLSGLKGLDKLDQLKDLSNLSKLDGLNGLSDKLKPLENLSKLDEIPSIKTEIHDTLNSFSNKLDELSFELAIDKPEDNNTKEIEKKLSTFKDELFENILEIFNQISFVVEAEDIKDFVEEKSDEIKKELKTSLGNNFNDILKSLDTLHEKTNNVDTNCFNIAEEIGKIKNKIELAQNGIKDTEDSDYSYTLQDVESDIAKLRLILNDIAKSKGKTTDRTEELGDFDALNENLLSISTRTNKLLLTSDESYNVLKDNLSDFKQIIYQLEERIKYIDNTEKISKIEKTLDKVNNLTLSCVKSDKIFNQTFMYLAEWVDDASESFENITEKVSEIDSVKISVMELKKTMPKKSDIEEVMIKISEKFDSQQERIDSLEAKIEEILEQTKSDGIKPDAKLTKKIDNIDKQLAKLGKHIEKLASYVEE